MTTKPAHTDDLLDRLLTMYSHRGDGIPTQYVNPDGPEAAARITADAAEIARLREALEWADRALQNFGVKPGGNARHSIRTDLNGDSHD